MSNFAWWYYTLSFTCSAVSKFSLRFDVLIQLSWYFVGLLSTSSRSWICNYFWLATIFKGDNWCVSWFIYCWLFHGHSSSEVFQIFLLWPCLGPANLYHVCWPWLWFKVTCVRIINCKLFFRFLSSVRSGTVCFLWLMCI